MRVFIRMGFPGGSDGKESTCNAGDLGSVPELGRSLGGGHGNPLQYSCLGNLHGQRNLVGYSPWGHKESDVTEQLNNNKREIAGFPTLLRIFKLTFTGIQNNTWRDRGCD